MPNGQYQARAVARGEAEAEAPSPVYPCWVPAEWEIACSLVKTIAPAAIKILAVLLELLSLGDHGNGNLHALWTNGQLCPLAGWRVLGKPFPPLFIHARKIVFVA